MMTYWGRAYGFFDRGEHVVLFRQLMRFAVIEDESIEALEEREEILQSNVQPEVHGVGGDKFRALHLGENMMLQRGGDVGQEHERGALVQLGQGRSEGFKHAELGQQRAAIVHVGLVFARPVKGFAWKHLEPGQINAMALVELQIFFREVIADDADEFDGTEKAGGDSGVAGRAAERRDFRRLAS